MREGFTLNMGASGNWFGFSGGLFPETRSYEIPAPKAIGLDGVSDAAEALHDMSRALTGNLEVFADDRAEFLEHFPDQDWARWTEIARLCESAGTGLELVVASLRETAGMLVEPRDRNFDPLAPSVAAFIVEAALQYLISCGHNLTNAGFRLCIEDPACRNLFSKSTGEVKKAYRGATGQAPEVSGWLYHSQARKIGRQLESLDNPAVRALRVAEHLFEAPPWKSISTARNEYFHRWRRGFRDGGDEPRVAATALHTVAVDAATCIGRAVPDFYHRLIEAYPTSVLSGHPLMGHMWITDTRSPEARLLLPDLPFRG